MRPFGFYMNGPGSYAHLPWDAGVRTIRAGGFDTVDVSASAGLRVSTSAGFTGVQRDALRALTMGAPLSISAVVTHVGLADSLRDARPLDIGGAVDVAVHMGAPTVLVHVGTGGDGPRDAAWSAAVRALQDAADYAADRRVAVCLDAVAPDFLTRSPAEVDRFLLEVDRSNVGWNFDPAFVSSCGFSFEDVKDRLGRWIRHVHLKDYRGTYPAVEWVIPGDGELRPSLWVDVLDRIGYEGAVVAEVIARPRGEPERWTLDDAVRRSYESLTTWLR